MVSLRFDMRSDMSIPFLEKFGHRLSPISVFIGIVVGFSLMVLAGRWAGKQNLFIAYERNYQMISPEGYFYPSLDNLTELVSHLASKRKILVLVGGDSVLLGVGQKKEELWTNELQRVLGSEFAVINLAFRGAYATEMGGVVAEVLSRRYPRLILVGHLNPLRVEPPVRDSTYEYLFWQAEASGKLADFALRSEELQKAFFGNDLKRRERITEAALRGYFDYRCRASDLWNYIGYHYLFTVFNFLKYPERFFEARRNSEEQMANVAPIPERFTFPEQSMRIIRRLFQSFVERDTNGDLRIKAGVYDSFVENAQAAFPDSFKPRTLIVLAYNAPYFANQLSRDEYSAYEFANAQGKAWLQKAGYHSVLIGPDLTNEDFADRVHLAASGG